MWEEYTAAGFLFETKEERQKALEEEQKIKQLEEKLNYDNLDAVAMVYVKSIKNRIFQTAVGYSYLKKQQTFLEKKQYNKMILKQYPIPVLEQTAYAKAGTNREELDETKRAQKELKVRINHQAALKKKLRYSIWVNIILVVTVIALFVIALTGENVNIMNYRQNIVNEYAEWEEELKEREGAVREKEKELQLVE